ncbi:MAG: fumarylacetoacetate hydrolase family protein [Proteobacteria bacterium]|nr:fumarylacetoacetate hydrolase family protein [Pseudomonadota bacterium]
MKVASFEIDGCGSYGVAVENGVREASAVFRAQYPDLRSVLEGDALADLEADRGGDRLALKDLHFLPTIPNPDKIICVGMNYRPHVEELGRDLPDRPVLFVRFRGSQSGHGRPILRPRASAMFDFEGELAVIIGRRARHLQRDAVGACIAGYCCFMDGTVRDWQWHTTQFTAGKNFHRSGSMGPWLVTPAQIPNPVELQLTTRVNGEIMQQGSIGDLIFDIPSLLEYCSTFAELLPGDVIATGTPGGVGAARNPPVWLKPGDRVEVDIGVVGCLVNTVRDE